MAVTPTYPGVYVQEIPSGVRTITGVSTSVTAFVGQARRGPLNRAVRIQNYADFERRFGGLDPESEMTYAVRAFFLNGGTEAFVVRVARDAVAAARTLQNQTPVDVLQVTALDQGASGNSIHLAVDYDTDNPGSHFNLTVHFDSPQGEAEDRIETFRNLSMSRHHPRYVEDMLNGVSQLVSVNRVAPPGALPEGTSTSATLTDDAGNLVDATHNRLRVAVNFGDPQDIQIDAAAVAAAGNAAAQLTELCQRINGQLDGADCAPSGNDAIRITSPATDESSSIRVSPGLANDVSVRLGLGTGNGGLEVDAMAGWRPSPVPVAGILTSGVLANANLGGAPATRPDANNHLLRVSIDGAGPDQVDLGTDIAAGANLAERLANLAGRLRDAVRAARPLHPGYRDFDCVVEGGNRLRLSSGSTGAGSTVLVEAADGDGLAAALSLLLTGAATAVAGSAVTLEGGNEQPFQLDEPVAVQLFVGDRVNRRGLYALENIDLFNLLVLPGVDNAAILADADAYCKERRAFFIVDAPRASVTPTQMETTISGTALPRSDYAAVYYPWLDLADPLRGGRPRRSAPSGTVAGIFARTDATRGVWKAPAGTEATLRGALGLVHPLTDPENGILNPLGVNCLRSFPVTGTVVWGSRTLRGADVLASEWKYVPVRRTALFIEESLYRGSQWVVFEPNDEPLWSQIRLNVGAFMQRLFLQGAFQGGSPNEAYLVKCDAETTTQDDIDRGVVNILVGFAPLKPAEFVILQIQQLAGQAQS